MNSQIADMNTRVANPLFNSNRFKLGTFSTNARGSALTTAPDAHRPTWPTNLRAAQLADAAGFEALVGVARWKGVIKGRLDHPTGIVLDPFIWAAGLAQATKYSAVFATTHAPTIHPIVAAKQAATVDIISGGRFGLNIVGGWNKPEFDMFGQPLADHDVRYEYLEEWLGVLERLWSSSEEFDFEGRFLKLEGAMSMPHPIQQPRPVIMNAGNSGRGQRFACEHADLCFITTKNQKVEDARREVESYKKLAREEYGREVKVWTVGVVVQGETRQAAEDYLNYFAVEHEDTPAVDIWMTRALEEGRGRGLDEAALNSPERRMRVAAAAGGALIVGSAADVADGLEKLSDMGIDGCLLAWNNFPDGLQRFNQEVMPLLEQRGLREAFAPPTADDASAAVS